MFAYVSYFLAIGVFHWAILTAKEAEHNTMIFVTLAAIVVGPPIWFVVEYWLLVSPSWRADEKLRNLVKFEQDFFRNIWIAVATFALAMLAFHKGTLVP